MEHTIGESGTSEVLNLKDPERIKIYYKLLYNYPSPNTRRVYLKELKKFYGFLKMRFTDISEFKIELAHVVAYKNELLTIGGERKDKLSQNSINRSFACLQTFYEYLLDQKLVLVIPLANFDLIDFFSHDRRHIFLW